MSDLGFASPAALAWLVVPLGLLLLCCLPARAPERAVGTVHVWRRVAPDASVRGAHRRRRVPAWLALLAAGLAALAVAAARPERTGAVAPTTLYVVVESGSALGLPWVDAAGRPAGTRIARGIARLDDWLARSVDGPVRLRWRVGGRILEEDEWRDSSALESALARAPAVDWSAEDRPGVVWLRARAPAERPEFASWVAAGGGSVPGPVAIDGGDELVLDGDELVRRPRGEPAPAVLIDAPEPWAAFVTAWAGARGLATEGGVPAAAVLRIETVGVAETAAMRPTGRDGWRATVALGPASPSDETASPRPAVGEPWLFAGDRAVVWSAPGRLAVLAGPWSDPAGDPARFALSVGRLLDRLRLPAEGTAPLAARRDQGAGGAHTGIVATADAPADRPLAHLPAAAGAVLLALAAIVAGRRS